MGIGGLNNGADLTLNQQMSQIVSKREDFKKNSKLLAKKLEKIVKDNA